MGRNWLLLLAGVAAADLIALAEPSVASAGDTRCVDLLPPGVYDNVIVLEGQNCFVFDAEIRGTLKALEGSTLTTSMTTVRGNLVGDKAKSVQVQISTVDGDVHFQGREGLFGFFSVRLSTVGGNLQGEKTGLADSIANTVRGDIHFKDGGGETAVCQTMVTTGGIQIEGMIGSVFVGPGGFLDCPTNSVLNGNIKVEDNLILDGGFLTIGGNGVAGNLQVFKNRGPGSKEVQGNNVGANIQCVENDAPFLGGPNVATKAEGQCF